MLQDFILYHVREVSLIQNKAEDGKPKTAAK